MSISLDKVKNKRQKRRGAQNEVMINHGTLFNDRLNMKFILTLSFYLPSFTLLWPGLLDFGYEIRRYEKINLFLRVSWDDLKDFFIIKDSADCKPF